MGGWQDIASAQQMRDIIRELVVREVNSTRPQPTLGEVTKINTNDAEVKLPGMSQSVAIRMHTIRPSQVGDIVRVEGVGPRRHITEVVNGSSLIRAGKLAAIAISTTSSAANVFVDTASGLLYRVSSSLRYKRNVESVDLSEETLMKLRPVSYMDKSINVSGNYIGLIAEELAELDDPVIEQLLLRDNMKRPDAIHYDRIAVLLIPIIQRLLQRVSELESKTEG